MNLLEHYIIEVKNITEFPAPDYLGKEYIEVEVFCDCWGNKRIVKHITTKENWIRELNQGYFMA